MDQTLADIPTDPVARERRRRQAIAGGYPLRRSRNAVATIAAMGAVVTEALTAADRLDAMGVPVNVVCITSPDLLFRALRALRARHGHDNAPTWILDQLSSPSTAMPLVTVLDGHPHTLAFLAGINQTPAAHLGVTHVSQSGALHDIYHHHGLDTDTIIQTTLDLRERVDPNA